MMIVTTKTVRSILPTLDVCFNRNLSLFFAVVGEVLSGHF